MMYIIYMGYIDRICQAARKTQKISEKWKNPVKPIEDHKKILPIAENRHEPAKEHN